MNRLLTYWLFLVFVVVISLGNTYAQEESKRKSKITPLPALSFSPETGLTFGVIGDYDFDLAKGNEAVSRSKLRGSLVGTTLGQFISEWTYLLFFPEDKIRFFGRSNFKNWIDRIYTQPYDCEMCPHYRSVVFEDDGTIKSEIEDIFFQFKSNRILTENSLFFKLGNKMYLGPSIEAEYVYNYRSAADETYAVIDNQTEIAVTPFDADAASFRFGAGIHGMFDTRDDKRNAYSGTFVQLQLLQMVDRFAAGNIDAKGSFLKVKFDARQFFSLTNSQSTILGLRFLTDLRLSTSAVPYNNYYGSPLLGGRDINRGYFQGTYYGEEYYGLQAEVRHRLFPDQSNILKRLGVVAFAAAGDAMDSLPETGLNPRLSAGGGLRILINENDRTNIRIDYGFGLDKSSSLEGGQRGLYFFLGEAF